jgi:hypothetical protein
VLGEAVAALLQQRGRLQGADADQRRRQVRPAAGHARHRGVGGQRLAGGGGGEQAGCGQEDRLTAGGRREPGQQTGGLDLHPGVADAADQLHDVGDDRLGGRAQRVDGGEQAGAPRGDAEPLGADQRRLQVLGGGGAQRAQVTGEVGVDHHGLGQAELPLQPLLQLGVHVRRHGDRGADDADLPGALEQAGHPGLRDVQLLGDLGLPLAALVVHPGDLGHQAHLVGALEHGAGRHRRGQLGHSALSFSDDRGFTDRV